MSPRRRPTSSQNRRLWDSAANAFLDGFAEYRRSRGAPALTINWGDLAEVGVAARNAPVEQVLNAAGLRSMHVDHALYALGQALPLKLPQAGIFQVDWERWRATHPGAATAALFESLFAEHSESSDGAGLDPHQQLLHRLTVLDAQARMDHMEILLAEEFARVVQMPVSQIDVQQNVMTLGIDSLMAVELQTALLAVISMRTHWYSRLVLARLIASLRYYLDNITRIPEERYAVLRYEDLCQDPGGCLSSVGARLGLDLVPRVPPNFVEPRQLAILPRALAPIPETARGTAALPGTLSLPVVPMKATTPPASPGWCLFNPD